MTAAQRVEVEDAIEAGNSQVQNAGPFVFQPAIDAAVRDSRLDLLALQMTATSGLGGIGRMIGLHCLPSTDYVSLGVDRSSATRSSFDELHGYCECPTAHSSLGTCVKALPVPASQIVKKDEGLDELCVPRS
jgi:hypothetical protein